MVSNVYLLLVSFAALCNTAFADSNELLKQAFPLFAHRAESLENVHKAKKLYLDVIKDKHATKDNRKTALDRFARLAVFEGEIATSHWNVKNSTKIFKDCIEATDHINEKSLGEPSAEYTYWRAMCIGLWASHSGKTEVLRHFGRINEMKSLLQIGLDKYKTFDSFGFNRMIAGIYVRSKGLTALGLYDPETSLKLIEETLKCGCDNYVNYIIKAEALAALDYQSKARQTLTNAIAELKAKFVSGMISPMYVAENEVFLAVMMNMLAKMS